LALLLRRHRSLEANQTLHVASLLTSAHCPVTTHDAAEAVRVVNGRRRVTEAEERWRFDARQQSMHLLHETTTTTTPSPPRLSGDLAASPPHPTGGDLATSLGAGATATRVLHTIVLQPTWPAMGDGPSTLTCCRCLASLIQQPKSRLERVPGYVLESQK